jgi:hypothetical protein
VISLSFWFSSFSAHSCCWISRTVPVPDYFCPRRVRKCSTSRCNFPTSSLLVAATSFLFSTMSTSLARSANFSVLTVSSIAEVEGLIVAMSSVLVLTPSESCRRRVSLESRYGMWVCSDFASPLMTYPSVDRDLLMFFISSRCAPSIAVSNFSDPAKSQRLTFARLNSPFLFAFSDSTSI